MDCQLVTVMQSSKGMQGILPLTNMYKGQWSPCPVQDVDTKNYVVTLGPIYKQCTFKRQCTYIALVAITQLLYLNCFRLETQSINSILLIHTIL